MFIQGHIEANCRRIRYGVWPFKKALFELLNDYNHEFITSGFNDVHTQVIPIGKDLHENAIKVHMRYNRLCLPKHYLWDGASGPCFNHGGTLRATAVHDALCILIAKLPNKFDPISQFRKAADKEMRAILHEDSHTRVRGRIWYFFVRVFGCVRLIKALLVSLNSKSKTST